MDLRRIFYGWLARLWFLTKNLQAWKHGGFKYLVKTTIKSQKPINIPLKTDQYDTRI
jgi:hypothetical protein